MSGANDCNRFWQQQGCWPSSATSIAAPPELIAGCLGAIRDSGMEQRLRKLVGDFAELILPCDVTSDDQLDMVFTAAGETFGQVDFVLHSIAYAPISELQGPAIASSREGFKLSMEVSVYSLLALANRSRRLLKPGGSILALTYLGGERVIPGYSIMGVCKSALESAVKYLAYDLGPDNIRINALSAGPIMTLSSSAVGDFSKMMALYESYSPLRRNIAPAEVGRTGMFLLSDLASGITGENVHVDAGYHVMGAPPAEAVGKTD